MKRKFGVVLMAFMLVYSILPAQMHGIHGEQICTEDHDHSHDQVYTHLFIPSASAEGVTDEDESMREQKTLEISPPETTDEQDVHQAEGRQILLLDARDEGALLSRSESKPIKTTTGMRLVAGDVVTTELGGVVFIQVDLDKLFRLDPDSSVTISKASDTSLLLTLTRGAMYFSIPSPLQENETLDMSAGNTTMCIRGTEGYIRYTEDEKRVETGIFKGLAEVFVKSENEGEPESVYEVSNGEQLAIGQDTKTPEVERGAFVDPKGGLEDIHKKQEETNPGTDTGAGTNPDGDNADQKKKNATGCGCAVGTHARLACGHFECAGGNHSQRCEHCGQHLCKGGDHGACAICGKPECIGEHGEELCAATSPEEEELVILTLCKACDTLLEPGVAHNCMLCRGYSCTGNHGAGVCVHQCPNCEEPVLHEADAHTCGLCGGWTCFDAVHGMNVCVHECGGCGQIVAGLDDIHKCAICSGYKCAGGMHGAGLCGAYTCSGCQAGGLTSINEHICGLCGSYVCQGGNHGAGICGRYTCPGCSTGGLPSINEHTCDLCGGYVCQGGNHGAGVCGRYTCPGCSTGRLPSINAHTCGLCGLYECVGHHGTNVCASFTCAGCLTEGLPSKNAHTCQVCGDYSCVGLHGVEVCGVAVCPACGEGKLPDDRAHQCGLCGAYMCQGGVHGNGLCGIICAGCSNTVLSAGDHSCRCGGYTCVGAHGDGICYQKCDGCGVGTGIGEHTCAYCGGYTCITGPHGQGICPGVDAWCVMCNMPADTPGAHRCGLCEGWSCQDGLTHGNGACRTRCPACVQDVGSVWEHACNLCNGFTCEPGHGTSTCFIYSGVTCGGVCGDNETVRDGAVINHSHYCTVCGGFKCVGPHGRGLCDTCPECGLIGQVSGIYHACVYCGICLNVGFGSHGIGVCILNYPCISCGGYITFDDEHICAFCSGYTCAADSIIHSNLGCRYTGFVFPTLQPSSIPPDDQPLPIVTPFILELNRLGGSGNIEACASCAVLTAPGAHVCVACGKHTCGAEHMTDGCSAYAALPGQAQPAAEPTTCAGCGQGVQTAYAHRCHWCVQLTCDGGEHGPNICAIVGTGDPISYCLQCGDSYTMSHQCAFCGQYTCTGGHAPRCEFGSTEVRVDWVPEERDLLWEDNHGNDTFSVQWIGRGQGRKALSS